MVKASDYFPRIQVIFEGHRHSTTSASEEGWKTTKGKIISGGYVTADELGNFPLCHVEDPFNESNNLCYHFSQNLVAVRQSLSPRQQAAMQTLKQFLGNRF